MPVVSLANCSLLCSPSNSVPRLLGDEEVVDRLQSKNIVWSRRTHSAIRIFPLPVCDGAVRPEVSLSASCNRLSDLGDFLQLFEVEFDPYTGPFVRIKFAVFEIQAYGKMRQRAALIVVLHQNRSRVSPETVH